MMTYLSKIRLFWVVEACKSTRGSGPLTVRVQIIKKIKGTNGNFVSYAEAFAQLDVKASRPQLLIADGDVRSSSMRSSRRLHSSLQKKSAFLLAF